MSLVIPSVILSYMAVQADEFLRTRCGFRIKQHYLVRFIACLAVAGMMLPPLRDFIHDPRLAYNTEYPVVRWGACVLLSYELYFMLETATPSVSDALSLTEVRRSLVTCLNLCLAHTMLAEGALHAYYLLFVVAIPEAIASLAVFQWVELALLSPSDCARIIRWVQAYFRVGALCIYVAVSATFAVWVAPTWSVTPFIALAGLMFEVLTSPWMAGEEPYANGNDWLLRYANRGQ